MDTGSIPVGSTKENRHPSDACFFLFFGGVTELNPLAHRKAQKYNKTQNQLLEKETLRCANRGQNIAPPFRVGTSQGGANSRRLHQMRFFGCFAIRRTFCFLCSSVRVEQIYSLLEKSSEYISGIEGSSLKSHSRRASLIRSLLRLLALLSSLQQNGYQPFLPRSPVGSTKKVASQ